MAEAPSCQSVSDIKTTANVGRNRSRAIRNVAGPARPHAATPSTSARRRRWSFAPARAAEGSPSSAIRYGRLQWSLAGAQPLPVAIEDHDGIGSELDEDLTT